MHQSGEYEQMLRLSLQQAVNEPNEIDFCGLVKMDSATGRHAIAIQVGGDTPKREIRSDMVTALVEAELRTYAILPFDTYRMNPSKINIVAWHPVWRAGNLESEKRYGGWFLLYISATPEGDSVMNAAIQKRGPEHVALARSFLDKL